jgi:hypothetical protein
VARAPGRLLPLARRDTERVNDETREQPPTASNPADTSGAYSARQMLAELDFPVRPWRDRHGRIQDAFVESIDPIIRLFLRSGGPGEGEGHFAIRQVTGRAINDLVVAVHLSLHGYLNQAYNSLRMAVECLELRELLAADAPAASEWVNSEKPFRDFAPGEVRRRLDRPSYNELHGLFSERSHPRFEAAKLTGFMTYEGDAAMPTAILRLGPFVLDGHPAVMEAVLYALDLTGQLTAESIPLVDFAPKLAPIDLLHAIRDSSAAVVAACELVEEELASIGASGAHLVTERHRRIHQEVSTALSLLGPLSRDSE